MDVRNLTDGYTAHLASWLRIKRVNPSVHKSTSSLGAGGAIHQDRQEVHKAFLEIDQVGVLQSGVPGSTMSHGKRSAFLGACTSAEPFRSSSQPGGSGKYCCEPLNRDLDHLSAQSV